MIDWRWQGKQMKKIIALYSASAVAWAFVLAGCCKAPVQSSDHVDGRFQYIPDAELLDAAGAATDALSTATGLTFGVGEAGTPVFATDPDLMYRCDVKNPKDCYYACGETTVTFDRNTKQIISLQIDIAYPAPANCYQDMSLTIEHEMIHAARGHVDLSAQIHSTHGVFQEHANPVDCKLEETSLSMLCEAVDCVTFTPEE